VGRYLPAGNAQAHRRQAGSDLARAAGKARDHRVKFLGMGIEPRSSTPEALAETDSVRAEAEYGKLIREAGIKGEYARSAEARAPSSTTPSDPALRKSRAISSYRANRPRLEAAYRGRRAAPPFCWSTVPSITRGASSAASARPLNLAKHFHEAAS